MNRCLSDAALYAEYAGDGDSAQQHHLNACSSCTQRYAQLAPRLGAIEHTLRQPPPRFARRAVSGRARYRYRLPIVATAVAAMLLLTWGIFRQKQSSVEDLTQAASRDVTRFLTTEVPSALFATVEAAELRPPLPISDAAYIEAALTDEWPCEYDEEGQTTACDIHPFPLLIEDD